MRSKTKPPFAIPVHGVTSVARAGKDTFVKLTQELMSERGIRVASLSFALELKLEIDPILKKKYNISAFTQKTEEKNIIRPDMVAFGCGKRKENADYWIKKLIPSIEQIARNGYYDMVMISDARFSNEIDWIHGLGGKIIHIERQDENGKVILPANEEEKYNDPINQGLSDFRVIWPTVGEKGLDKLKPFVQDIWSKTNCYE